MGDTLDLHRTGVVVSIPFSPFPLKKGDRMETKTLLSVHFWLEKVVFSAELEAYISLIFFFKTLYH